MQEREYIELQTQKTIDRIKLWEPKIGEKLLLKADYENKMDTEYVYDNFNTVKMPTLYQFLREFDWNKTEPVDEMQWADMWDSIEINRAAKERIIRAYEEVRNKRAKVLNMSLGSVIYDDIMMYATAYGMPVFEVRVEKDSTHYKKTSQIYRDFYEFDAKSMLKSTISRIDFMGSFADNRLVGDFNSPGLVAKWTFDIIQDDSLVIHSDYWN